MNLLKLRLCRFTLGFLAIVIALSQNQSLAENNTSVERLAVATFDIDATPPIGSMMAYDRVRSTGELGLRCRGIVLLGSGQPIVLCAVDWIGIGNQSHDLFRDRIATAAETTPTRVAVHTLHQHDAPRSDFGAESLLQQIGVSDLGAHDGRFARQVIDRLCEEIARAVEVAQPVTHAGFGVANVEQVASNRRIQDESGQVIATRYTATRDAAIRAFPVGTIDPVLSSLSFWNDDKPIAVISYYACHPQSYYRTGIPNPDFPGIARFMQSQNAPGPLYVHFNGAGGNIGAGKYNDGSPQNRLILATRVATAMQAALDATEKFDVTADDIQWNVKPVALPPAKHLDRDELTASLANWNDATYWGSPDKLAWLLRCESGHKIDVGCLSVGDVRALYLPGELFVEYQLAAKAMRPDLKVTMAAYGDYGTGYIGTAEAYGQGGYETSQPASNVGPDTEPILMDAMRSLLDVAETE
ncbi:MAG: hypothetical protein WBD31_04220 [Rubripirellula sp.]